MADHGAVDPLDTAPNCWSRHPLFPEVTCAGREHPHRFPHWANGVTDGIHWSTRWWDPGAALDRPDESASDPGLRDRNAGPG